MEKMSVLNQISGINIGIVGKAKVPAEKKVEFANQMIKLFQTAGICELQWIGVGTGFYLMIPPNPKRPHGFTVNGSFLDERMYEPIRFNTEECYLESGNLGNGVYSSVAAAAYMLWEQYADNALVVADETRIYLESVLGWLNFSLGTQFTLEKRTDAGRIYEILEQYSQGRLPELPKFLACVAPGINPMEPATKVSTDKYLCVNPDDLLYVWNLRKDTPLSECMWEIIYQWEEEYHKILKEASYPSESPEVLRKRMLNDMCMAEAVYTRVWIWSDVFREWLIHTGSPEHLAAWELFHRILKRHENDWKVRELAKAVEAHGWELTPVDLKYNEGRNEVKQFLSLLHNRELRKLVLGF